MIVVDASALVELLMGMPAADAVEGRLFRAGETLHAPHLIGIEMAHAMRRLALTRQSEAERCRVALDDFSELRIVRHPHENLLPRVWELRHNLTAYDAVYVALAEELGAPLVTRDRRIAAAGGHRAQIDLV